MLIFDSDEDEDELLLEAEDEAGKEAFMLEGKGLKLPTAGGDIKKGKALFCGASGYGKAELLFEEDEDELLLE